MVRCHKNVPAPTFCPYDNMEQAREGHLADLTYVELQEDGRWAAFPRLSYVGQGWYAWPEGEEHYAKLSMDLIYTMRTSNHQFDGSGCQHRELFLDAAGGTTST